MDTMAKVAAVELEEQDVMWLMSMIRGYSLDISEFKQIVDINIKNEKAKKLFTFKLNDLLEYTEGMEFEVDNIYNELNVVVDEEGYYPVLLKKEAKKDFNWVNLFDINSNDFIINKNTFKVAQLVHGHMPIYPISLTLLDDKKYSINYGHDFVLAFKLNEIEKIPAYIN